MMGYDRFDLAILTALHKDSKISNFALARKIRLSPPATLERVKKLRQNEIILGQKAILDKKKLGRGLTCFISLQIKHLHKGEEYELIERELQQLEEIEEIYFLTGRIDYLIKVNIRDIDEFKEFFMARLSRVKLIERAETFVVVSSAANPNYNPINIRDGVAKAGHKEGAASELDTAFGPGLPSSHNRRKARSHLRADV